MELNRRGFLRTGLATAGVAAFGSQLLAACGGGGGGAAASGTVTIAIASPLTTLDPPLINSNDAASVLHPILETFAKVDADGKIVPALAEKWTVGSDKTTWTLALRQGVKFHDGSPWNATVAKTNLDRYLSRPDYFPRAQGYNFVDQVTVVDPNTLEIRTKFPHSGFINWMSYYATWMVSGEAIKEYGDKVGQNAVGTGPFRMTGFVPSQSVDMAVFKDYWGGASALEKLTAKSTPSGQGRVNSLRSHGAEIVGNVPANLVKSLESDSKYTMDVAPSVRAYFIGINCQHPDLTDVRVRQAMNYAVDKEAIVKNALQGAAQVSTSPMPDVIRGYQKQTPYTYDPGRAESLLAEAGWSRSGDGLLQKDGRSLTLEIQATDGNFLGDRVTCEAVQEYLRKAGIDVGLKVVDYNSYFSGLQDPASISKVTLNSFAFGSTIVEPSHALGGFEGSWKNIVSSVSRYRSSEFDAAYQKMLTAVDDEAAQASATADAQRIAWEDAPWLFLHVVDSLTASSSELTNVTMGVNEFLDLSHTAYAK
jgi:glutathione transport system substrate-binding protein